MMLAEKTAKTTAKSTPDPVDVFVGKKIRQRRTLMGISQEKLSEALGITFQQVQKYESGANRVSASRLYHIGKILKIEPSFFFDGIDGDSKPIMSAVAEKNKPMDNQDLFSRKETLDLLKHYYSIENIDVRKHLLEMVKSASSTHKAMNK